MLKAAQTFDELFAVVNGFIRGINGIGELAVYDTAVRLGARLGISPERIYLHPGTRDGARALGLEVRRGELPQELRELTA